MRRKPNQKMGMEKPPTATTMTARSTSEPARQAARTPSGIAIRMANVSVLTAKAAVGSSRCSIS